MDGTRHAQFCSYRSRGFCSPNTWFCRASGVSFFVFGGFFNKATAYTPERTFTQYTSNDVVPSKEVPFGGHVDCILYLDPLIFEKPPFWGPILTTLFAAENHFNMGMLKYKSTLNRHRSPIKVVWWIRQFGANKLLPLVLRDPLCTGHVILRMRSELCSLYYGINAFFRR